MDIVIDPNPILHRVTKPVTSFGDSLKKLAAEMRQTMHTHRGMGLAAPQVNLDQQLAIIEYLPEGKESDRGEAVPFLAVVNPTITWASKQQLIMTEGCLSIPGYEGEVSRPKRIKLKARDLDGNPVVIKAAGLMARILQHEIDHLNGILYPERLVPGTVLTKKE